MSPESWGCGPVGAESAAAQAYELLKGGARCGGGEGEQEAWHSTATGPRQPMESTHAQCSKVLLGHSFSVGECYQPSRELMF